MLTPSASIAPGTDILRERVWKLLVLLLFLLPLVPIPTVAEAGLTTTPEVFRFALCALATAVVALGVFILVWRGTLRIVWSPVLTGLGIWLGIRVLSTLFSGYPALAFWGTYGAPADGLGYTFCALAFFMMVMVLQPSLKEMRLLCMALVAQSLILAVATLHEAVGLGFPHLVVRPDSPFYNSDFFIIYTLLILPLGVEWLLRSVSRRSLQVVGATAYLLVGLLAIWVSTPLQLQHQVLPNHAVQGAERVPDSVTGFLLDTSNQGRYTLWQLALSTAKDHPLLGTGPGLFRRGFFAHAQDLPNWNYREVAANAHNDVLEQLATTGFLGLAAYLFWGVWAAGHFRRLRRRDGDVRSLAGALIAGLVLSLLFSEVFFFTVVSGLIVWVWVALLLGLASTGDALPDRLEKYVKGLVVLSVSCLFVLAWGALRHYQADQADTRMLAAGNRGDYVQAAGYAEQGASLFPFEASYAKAASNYILLTMLVGKVRAVDVPNTLQRVDAYAKKAVQLEPFNPDLAVNLGIIHYVTAEPGSSSESAALDELKRALTRSPYNDQAYQRVLQTIKLKGPADQVQKREQGLLDGTPRLLQIKLQNS